MNKATAIVFLFIAASGLGHDRRSAAKPAAGGPLERAIEAIGGDAALERAKSVSLLMVGTQDMKAIDQGYFAARPSPQRQQESLIIDGPSRRAVIRTEGGNSDRSPTIWRNTALGDTGFRLKVKTGSVSRMNTEQTAHLYANLRWRCLSLRFRI